VLFVLSSNHLSLEDSSWPPRFRSSRSVIYSLLYPLCRYVLHALFCSILYSHLFYLSWFLGTHTLKLATLFSLFSLLLRLQNTWRTYPLSVQYVLSSLHVFYTILIFFTHPLSCSVLHAVLSFMLLYLLVQLCPRSAEQASGRAIL